MPASVKSWAIDWKERLEQTLSAVVLFQICMLVAWIKAVVILLYGSAFAVDFAILWSHFWYRQTVPKMDRENAFFFCSFTPQLCMRSQKWDRLAVPFLGLSLGSFFEVFCIRVEEAQCFGFNWLFERSRFWEGFTDPKLGPSEQAVLSLFCFSLEQAGCISVAAWTELLIISFRVVAWLLEVFLAVAEFVGFRAGGRLPFEWLYWTLYGKLYGFLVGPPCPSGLLPTFSAWKEHESSSFQSIPLLLISSISLKRDGVRIWFGKDMERLSFEGFLTRSSFVYCVNYIGCLH